MHSRYFFSATVVLFLSLSNTEISYADTVKLNNGDVISGQLMSYGERVCIFNTRYGAVIRIETESIKSLITDENYNITFINGDSANGKLIQGKNDTVLLDSTTFGKVSINIDSIDTLVRRYDTQTSNEKNIAKESFGKKDTQKTPPLDFLTGSTVLLAKGQYELELGVTHRQSRDNYALPNAGHFQRSSFTANVFQFNTTLRGGLADGLEGWINLPFTYTSIEQVSTNTFVREKDAWDIADISLGLQYALLQESTLYPAITATLDISTPTGEKKYNDIVNAWLDPLNNGSGHWSIAPGLAFVRTTDPAILYGGFNYRYFLSENISGFKVQPGWMLSGYFGVGFALNNDLSLGTQLSAAYQSNLEADGVEVKGSHLTPLDLSFSASYRLNQKWVAVTQVAFNLNDDAGTPGLSLRLKRGLDL